MDTQDPPTDPAISLLGVLDSGWDKVKYNENLDDPGLRQRKRCYDVRLSRQEGSMRRHLGSAQYYGPASRWKHRTSFSDVWRAGLRRPV